MTLNFNIKQKGYTYSILQIVLNNVELVSIGKKKSQFFDFWPHDFDFAPLCVATQFTRYFKPFTGYSVKYEKYVQAVPLWQVRMQSTL